jgi:hypothetical protein
MVLLEMALLGMHIIAMAAFLATVGCEQQAGKAAGGGQPQQAPVGGMEAAENDAREQPVLQNPPPPTSKAGDFVGQQGDLPAVIRRHRNEVMKLPNVVGMGAGLCRNRSGHCILVYVTRDQWPPGLPRDLEGIPIELVQVGQGFRPQ